MLRSHAVLMSLSLLLPAPLTGCAEILALPPVVGGLREVHVERPPAGDAETPWRVGAITALPPTPLDEVQPGRGDESASVVQIWDVIAAEPHGVVWQAACIASSYLTRTVAGHVATYRNPTAVVCDLRRHADEGFRFELTRSGSTYGVGRTRDTGGSVVTFDRAEGPADGMEVPTEFFLRIEGRSVGWLRTRPTPRLFVLRDLDPQRQRAVERATLLALALDVRAARWLTGAAQLPAPWARSNRPNRVATGVQEP